MGIVSLTAMFNCLDRWDFYKAVGLLQSGYWYNLLPNFTVSQVISSFVTSWQLQALLGRKRVTVKMNSLLA